MTGWVILVESLKDFPNAETPHKVITTRDYLTRQQLFAGGRPKLINLTRNYAYQSAGYYASLLAEARGHRILPTVESMLELSRRNLYAHALPDLEDRLNKTAQKLDQAPEESFVLFTAFGKADDPRFDSLARLVFDYFRCPAVEITVEVGPWLTIRKLKPRTIDRLSTLEADFFRTALHNHTRREWRTPRTREPADYTLAVLHDPKEEMAPSDLGTIKRLARIAEKMKIEVEPVTRKDINRIAEFDALFIRETTSIDNHTYQFARRAAQEGIPAIDDPLSIIRCTNKVYLNELLRTHNVPTPKTVMLAQAKDLDAAADQLGFPMVIKIPDGSFSRGVHKVDDMAALKARTAEMFNDSDLLLAQEFMPTDLDWRVGVLGGEPLFVCQYYMAKKHWQIIHHKGDGKHIEGAHKTFAVEDAPAHVVSIAQKAASLIGDGLYGVDIKETGGGAYVIEVNDNPNLDHGVEDAVLKDELWVRLLEWFLDRLK